MNVFSEAAIVEIGRIARWLEEADVSGALIRSGKTSGFCAGANLPEIWAAYDMIMATPKPRRFRTAYDHFFRLSLGCARWKPAASRSRRRSRVSRSAAAANSRSPRTIAC